MNEKEIIRLAYPKANRMEDGDRTITIKDFTNDELRVLLLTVDGMGEDFKEKALNELLERR